MTGTQPDQKVPSSSAGSFSQFRLQAPEPRRRTHESTWTRLADSVPKTETGWQTARVRKSFDSAEGILGTLTQLLDSNESDLHRIVFFAECKVDSYGKKVPYSTVRAAMNNPELAQVIIERYLNTVVRLVRLLDELYLAGPRHRAFELLLYIPTKLANLRQYVENPTRFKSHCTTESPRPEIQGSIVLYIPFLIRLKRPDLSHDRICEALGTRLFDQQEFSRFLSAIQTGNLVPRLPPLPSFTPPLRIIQHFEAFGLSERLKKKVQESADQLRGFDPVAPVTPVESSLYGYQWSPTHQDVVDETVTHLVSLGFLVKGEYFRCTSHAIHHKSGSLPTPDGQFQVIIPITRNKGPLTVSLSHALGETRVTWGIQSGLLMNQGMSLLTEHPIDYIVTRYAALFTVAPDP